MKNFKDELSCSEWHNGEYKTQFLLKLIAELLNEISQKIKPDPEPYTSRYSR